MFVLPNNLSVQGTGFVPLTPFVTTPVAPTSAVATARQTQIAVSGLDTTLISNNTNNRPATVLQPRPAYIAAQFLAQDLSVQEVEAFFTPTAPAASQATTSLPQQLSSTSATSAQTATQNQAEIAAPTIVVSQQATTAINRPRRDEGLSAYNATNALLASAPEVDTRL